MKKKKIYVISGLAALVVVGLVAWFLLRGHDDGCARALPANVTMVGRVNPTELVLQNGLELSDFKRIFSSGDSEVGIDLSSDSYLFSAEGYFGAVLPLSDADDFAMTLTDKGVNVEHQRGMQWAVLGGTFLLCMDDDRAIVMGPATGGELDALRNTLYTCMKQDKEESGMQSVAYQTLETREEPMAIAANLGVIPESYCGKLKALLPKGVTRDQITLATGIKFDKNALECTIGLDSPDGNVKAWLEKCDEALCPIAGDLANPESFFTLYAGIHGEKFLKLLRQNPDTRTKLLALNMGMDFDMMMKSIDGDISFVLPSAPSIISFGGQKGIFRASLTEDKFMQNVSSWNEGVSEEFGLHFVPARNDSYLCSFRDMAFYFGVRDHQLYASNDEALTLPNSTATLQRCNASDIKDKKVFATVDLSGMSPWLQMLPSILPGGFTRALSQVTRVTLSARQADDWTLRFEAPEGTDLLRTIVK